MYLNYNIPCNREAEETARAITASLADMQRTGHVNVVDEAMVRPVTTVDQNRGEKYTESSSDFPTLDGKVVDEDRTSDEDVAPGKDPGQGRCKDTMAKKVARANMFSVAEGDMGNEDFPSLGGGAPTVQAREPIAAPARPKPNRNVSAQQWQAPIMENDFPALGGSRPAKPIHTQSVSSMTTKPLRSANAQPSTQRQPPAIDDYPALGRGNRKPIQTQPAGAMTAKPTIAQQQPPVMDDFPALGGGNRKPIETQLATAKPMRVISAVQQQQTPVVDDFPALGGSGKPRQGFPLKQNTWVSAPSSATTSSKKATQKPTQNKPVQQKTSQNKPKTSSFQDYPTLGSIGGSLTKTLNTKGNTTEELLASAPVPSSQTMTSNIRVVEAVSNDPPPSLSNVASIVSKPVKMNEGDFPSLGCKDKSTTGAVQWGPKPKQPENEEKQEKSDKQEGQFMVAKLKNKNKKKNKASIDDMDSGSAQGSESETKTTSKRSTKAKAKPKEDSEFDYEIHSEKTEYNAKESEKVPSGKSKKKKVREAKENKVSDVSSSTTVRELSSKSEPQDKDDAKVLSPKVIEPSDDFPSLTALKDQSNLPSKVAELKLDDFPVLSGNLVPPPAVAPPPPGLTKPTTGPPGFNFSTASNISSISAATSAKSTPPPGFISLGNIITQVKVEPEVIPEPEPSGGNGEPRSFEFTPPPNFMERNQRLISNIQRHVKDDESKFNEFKSCSGQFRTDKMGPYDYYDRCSNIIGKDNFRMILPELLVLLPDISKQQELFKAHNAAMRLSQGKKSQVKGKKKAMWSTGESPFISCSICNQVILNKDLSDHQKSHSIESDFPSLGSNTTSGSNHGMSAWVRAK